jgi:hypothetical protein
MISARPLVEPGIETEAAMDRVRAAAGCDRDAAARGMGEERFAAILNRLVMIGSNGRCFE